MNIKILCLDSSSAIVAFDRWCRVYAGFIKSKVYPILEINNDIVVEFEVAPAKIFGRSATCLIVDEVENIK